MCRYNQINCNGPPQGFGLPNFEQPRDKKGERLPEYFQRTTLQCEQQPGVDEFKTGLT